MVKVLSLIQKKKCKQLSAELKRRNLQDQVIIEIDGGINQETIGKMYDAGARMFVAGSAVYSKPDRKEAINILRSSV